MLLLMLERRMPIDMVLTADTGMEFPEMYEHLAKLDEHLYRERGSAGKRSVVRNDDDLSEAESKNDEYRSRIKRFTLQFSLGDGEAREWFEQQPEQGTYLKGLILRDKAEQLGYREQKASTPRRAGDYEIIQSIRMGGMTMLIGYNPGDTTYMTCYQDYDFLGNERFSEAIGSESYVEIMDVFLQRLREQTEKVRTFQAERAIPVTVLGREYCLPCSDESLEGKLVIIRPASLAPEYRTADCQLGYALGGFGCSPGSRGRAVYFEDLFSGKRCRWDRTDILGIADREKLPDWAKEKAEEYEQHRTAQKKERGEER